MCEPEVASLCLSRLNQTIRHSWEADLCCAFTKDDFAGFFLGKRVNYIYYIYCIPAVMYHCQKAGPSLWHNFDGRVDPNLTVLSSCSLTINVIRFVVVILCEVII